MLEIKSFQFDNQDLIAKAFAIRTSVFVKEQGVDSDLEMDENDAIAHHYLVSDNDVAIATARWRETSNGIKLERFAVLENFRNQKIGDILLKKVLQDILPLNKTIYLHSQLKAVSFYERNGFVKIGEIFEEAGIKHYNMYYKSV